jgi:hypothetical protein
MSYSDALSDLRNEIRTGADAELAALEIAEEYGLDADELFARYNRTQVAAAADQRQAKADAEKAEQTRKVVMEAFVIAAYKAGF